MNIALIEEFPERTIEGIKRHRRSQAYTDLVVEAIAQIQQNRPQQRQRPRRGRRSLLDDPPPDEENENPFRLYFEALEPLPHDLDGAYRLQELYSICKDTSNNTKEQIAARVALYISHVIPPAPRGFLKSASPETTALKKKGKEAAVRQNPDHVWEK